MVGGDGDDDDFQSPSQPISLSQRLILSLRSDRSQPLGPLSGGRAWKRPRLSVPRGKENLKTSKNLASAATVPKVQGKNVLKGKMAPGAGKMNVDGTCCTGGDIMEPEFVPSASDVPKHRKNRSLGERQREEGSHCFVSVESSLLASAMSAFSPYSGSGDSGVSTDNGEVAAGIKDSCDLGELAAVLGMEAACECKKCLESIKKGVCHESVDSSLDEDWVRCKMGIQVLNNFSDNGLEVEKNGGSIVSSTEARLVELTEESFKVGDEEYSSEFDGVVEFEHIEKCSKFELDEQRHVGQSQVMSPASFVENIVLVEKRKENHCGMSGEAKLLDSSVMKVHSAVECGNFDSNGCDEFETGTQLNVLVNLCCDMGEQEGSSCGKFPIEHLTEGTISLESEGNLSCPLCESDITDLSEESRHIHTNNCLDKVEKHEKSEVFSFVDHGKSNACQQLLASNPVLEWLKSLGLDQYEEIFIKEKVDWDTLQRLTEKDLISIGVVTIGPRKKLLHALNELRPRNFRDDHTDNDTSNVVVDEKIKIPQPGNKLITEYFCEIVGNKVSGTNSAKLFHMVKKANVGQTHHTISTTRNASRVRAENVPPWCCIPGTPFRVDAFRYLRRDCSHWFLTHFHMDHYQGLTKNFCHGKLYCSKITAELVNMKIGIPWYRIQILPLNQKITIAGVNLTCLEANHCPGSIIILFEPSNQKAILHTGDFRFSAEMAASLILQSSHIHTLILDTTYCSPQYDFPKQEEVIEFVIDAIQAEAFNPNTLFLIGTYTIGKEKLFLEVARALRTKVYVGSGKFHLLKCMGLPEEDMKWFTTNEMESHIHVVPMWTIASFKRMKYISNKYSDHYNLIVSFSPTGWSSGKGKKKMPARRLQQGTIIRYEVPYSEHCSFTELKDFVRFISPEKIIPSVNNDGPDSAKAMIDLLLPDSKLEPGLQSVSC